MNTLNCSIKAKKTNRISFLFIIPFLVFQSCRHSKETTKTSTVKSSPKNTEKVAQVLGVSEKEIKENKLYKFIGDWYGTTYKYGGCDKNGIDCSCFIGTLYTNVYRVSLQRNASAIHKECKRVKESNLKEGDFVFFKIGTKEVSHVGVYLKDNKFVHASTSKGVIINDLNDPYYKKYFYEGGKLRD